MKCEHLENPVNGRDLYYYWPDGNEAGFLCDECAVEAGFCPSCGTFVGGVEADDHSINDYGMCHECLMELRTEFGEFDE